MVQSELPVSLPHVCAPREELLRVFEQRAERQTVYIHAPAGYGKTVSTLLWLKNSGRMFAWLFLDEYDNVLSLFYRSLCQSLLTVAQSGWEDGAQAQQNSELLQLISSPVFSASPVENTIELISMLSWHKGKYALVLDDLHNITNEEILKSLPYVLKRLPPFVNALLLSRTAPPDALQAVADKDKTGFITSQELRFSPEEIRRYFMNHGQMVSLERAIDIHAYTDGWAIILNAMTLPGGQALSYKENMPTLEDFFEKNIWSSFDEDTRLFLMRTSLVDSFTLELCELLTGNENSAEVLSGLLRGNINLTRIGQEYHYHRLFLEFLREKASKSALDISMLYKEATEYYLSKNDVLTGRRYAVKSGDVDAMVKAYSAINKFKNLSLDEYAEQGSLALRDFPPESFLDKLPFLYLQVMFVSWLNGNAERFLSYFDKLYALLPYMAREFPQFVERTVINSILDFRIKFADYARHVKSLPAVTYQHEIDQTSNIAIQMPFLHRGSRDCYELVNADVRERVVDEGFRELLPYDCDNLFLGIEAGLYLEQNRLDEAREVLLCSEGLLNDKVSFDLGWATYIMLAEAALRKGDRKGYEQYKARAKEYFEGRQAFYYNKNFLAYEARALLWDGDVDAARSWMGRYFVSEGEWGVLYKYYQNFTTVRAYIVLGKSAEALAALQELGALARDFDRPLDGAEADVLTAIVEWETGKRIEARDRLYRLLVDLLPYRFIRVVANEGKSVLPILSAVIKKLGSEMGSEAAGGEAARSEAAGGEGQGETGGEALYRFAREVYVVAYESSKRFRGLTYGLQLKTVKLSPRQTLVLELLSKGHSNAEIIRITGLSINTIREHTRIAYKKLEVTTALDAVVRARELGLLK